MSTRYRFMQIVPSPHALIEKQQIEAPLKEAEVAFLLLVLDESAFVAAKIISPSGSVFPLVHNVA